MEFVLTRPDGKSERLPPRSDRLTIGRASENHIVISDPLLSRRHAILTRDHRGTWWIEDLGSRNGTWLLGEQVTAPRELHVGDVIELGSARLTAAHADDPLPSGPSIKTAPAEHGTIIHSRTSGMSLGGRGVLLAEASRALVTPEPTNTKLETLLRLALRTTHAERGIIASVDTDGELRPLVSVPPLDPNNPPRISRAVRERVLRSGEAVIVADVHSDAALKMAQTLLDAGVRSVLCAPLGSSSRVPIGLLYLDSIGQSAAFEEDHLDVATVLAGMAGITLESEASRLELEEKRRLDAELAAAWEIQQHLLPPTRPKVPEGFCACSHHSPSRSVGGDLFDFFSAGENCWGAMVADVAGKGLTAALLGAELHGRWKGLTSDPDQAETWLSRLNLPLLETLPEGRFVTLAFGLVDCEREVLRIASAGQASLLVSGNDVEKLGATGMVLGMMPDPEYGMIERPFPPGSRLLLFSDGVTDQMSPDGEPFDMERLVATVREHASDPAEDLSGPSCRRSPSTRRARRRTTTPR